jgi:hypothetical protein
VGTAERLLGFAVTLSRCLFGRSSRPGGLRIAADATFDVEWPRVYWRSLCLVFQPAPVPTVPANHGHRACSRKDAWSSLRPAWDATRCEAMTRKLPAVISDSGI